MTPRMFAAILLVFVLVYLGPVAEGREVLSADASKLTPAVSKHTLVVSIGKGAPDCFEKQVVLINGKFQPTLTFRQNEIVEITIVNNIPEDFPTTAHGISIHWHGLRMHGNASWYDGVAFTHMCPIPYGANFTYQFLVDETPGTYFYHDHSTSLTADGLQGPLIIRPPKKNAAPEPFDYDAEQVLFISDWWHAASGAMAMQLNRPFDVKKQTNDSGGWAWVGNPQALLLNGVGISQDCLSAAANATANGTEVPASCFPRAGAGVQAGCEYKKVFVKKGTTNRLRIISGTSLMYITVCFESHKIQVVATDGMPSRQVMLADGCVDLNSGQRMDVLLTANQRKADYWITIVGQYRAGAVPGRAILSYRGEGKRTPLSTTLPNATAVLPWNATQAARFAPLTKLLKPGKNDAKLVQQLLKPYALNNLVPPQKATRSFLFTVSQPLLVNGQLRWALNNVAMMKAPPCEATMRLIYEQPNFIEQHAVKGNLSQPLNMSALLEVEDFGPGYDAVNVFTNATAMPTYPTLGLHLIPLDYDDTVDVVITNGPANGFNGDYRVPEGANRTAMEQHPFHLHGHKFWVLGEGMGSYNGSQALDLKKAPFRDTATLRAGGWLYLRFQANNPGVWLLHCHILWHLGMGQQLAFVSAAPMISAPPPNLSQHCEAACRNGAAPYTRTFVNATFGGVRGKYELPP